MKHILALDSSSSTLSLCLATYEERSIHSFHDLTLCSSYSRHELHAPLSFQRILQSASLSVVQLSSLILGMGPGSFTGLRIGMSMAKACMASHKLPVYGISLLEAISYQTSWPGLVLGVVGSSKHRFFYQLARNKNPLIEIGEDTEENILSHARKLQEKSEPIFITGPSANMFSPSSWIITDQSYHLSARTLILDSTERPLSPISTESSPLYGAQAKTNKKGVEQKLRYEL